MSAKKSQDGPEERYSHQPGNALGQHLLLRGSDPYCAALHRPVRTMSNRSIDPALDSTHAYRTSVEEDQ